jgi:3-methyladenine DNA glycosylase AlkD
LSALEALRRDLRATADPERAKFMRLYIKAYPGGYGEGDVVIGVRVPAVRAAARRHAALPIADVRALLASEVHEERLAALVLLVARYRKGDAAERGRIYDLYLASTGRVNNWDLVDASAPGIVGEHLRTRPRDVLDRLAASPLVWERRIAIVATLTLIRAGEYGDTLRLARTLLGDDHDLIHKAAGWMLREVGKRDEAVMVAFVERHRAEMPRTMLRYAIERLEPERRAALMAR